MFFVIATFGVIYLNSPVHHTHVNVNHSFVVNEDFTKVKKILIRTNVLERIAELSGATIEDSKWQNATVGMVRLTRWDVAVEGDLRVRVRELSGVLYIKQKTLISNDVIDTLLTLKEPTPPLQSYIDRTIFERQSNGTTLVKMQLQMDVAKKLPTPFHNHMDRIVWTNVNVTAAEHELKKIIDEYKDQRIIIPINPRN